MRTARGGVGATHSDARGHGVQRPRGEFGFAEWRNHAGGPVDGARVDCLAIIPGHPVLRRSLELVAVPQQPGQVVVRVGIRELARVIKLT